MGRYYRLREQQGKLEDKLGGPNPLADGWLVPPAPDRPKGMRHRTYRRLRARWTSYAERIGAQIERR